MLDTFETSIIGTSKNEKMGSQEKVQGGKVNLKLYEPMKPFRAKVVNSGKQGYHNTALNAPIELVLVDLPSLSLET